MASEEPVQEETQAPSAKKKSEVFRIHSMVRKVQTKNQRMKAATHHRFVQRFGGGAITVRRARPATVTRPLLERYMKEIQQAVEEGKVIVKTLTGGVVDLKTFTVTEPSTVAKPLPNPPLDSAANDKTFEFGVGEKMPIFDGGGVPGDDKAPPELKTSILSDDAPISSGGSDPVLARALAEEEEKLTLESAGELTEEGEGLEEDLGGESSESPSIERREGDTQPAGKRARDKKKGGNK